MDQNGCCLFTLLEATRDYKPEPDESDKEITRVQQFWLYVSGPDDKSHDLLEKVKQSTVSHRKLTLPITPAKLKYWINPRMQHGIASEINELEMELDVVLDYSFEERQPGHEMKKEDLFLDQMESSVDIIGHLEDILEMDKKFQQLEERTLVKGIHFDNAKMSILMRKAIRSVWEPLQESLMINFQPVSEGMRIVDIDESSLIEAECVLKELAEPRYSKIPHSLAEPFYRHYYGKMSWREMTLHWNVSVDWSASDNEPPCVLVCHGLQKNVEKWIEGITSEIDSFYKAKKLIQLNEMEFSSLEEKKGRIALRKLLKDLPVGWTLEQNGILLYAKDEKSLHKAVALLERQRPHMTAKSDKCFPKIARSFRSEAAIDLASVMDDS